MGTTDSPYSVSAKTFLAENSQYNGEAISASNYLHFGHYTQCVWKHTTKIGMAVSKDSHGVSWVVARYQKPVSAKSLTKVSAPVYPYAAVRKKMITELRLKGLTVIITDKYIRRG
ncbi:hypothetical protein FOPG_17685 [Fusarium oxysporum f. sp. conglutinans race 2 54008]|nr:hypothetical protein FOPG_17685 [Fusarium oxysporum f. sp. conglutinans race 2 54008]